MVFSPPMKKGPDAWVCADGSGLWKTWRSLTDIPAVDCRCVHAIPVRCMLATGGSQFYSD